MLRKLRCIFSATDDNDTGFGLDFVADSSFKDAIDPMSQKATHKHAMSIKSKMIKIKNTN